MKQTLFLILASILISCCNSKSEYKTIDFESFEITVPQDWSQIEIKGTDSYVGGVITEKKDTLIFDIGWYSGDVTKNNISLVYDKKSYAELSKIQKELLKKTKHLVVDSISGNIDFKKYLKQKFVSQKIDCFMAKLITPVNKEFGTTGIYIDSLEGSKKNFNKTRMSFYGQNLKEKTEKEFIKALKTIKFKEYCH
ncbi:hypothetical protein [Flavobacterium chilense]|uniref:Uncharacterized protein n=1 Tax=Flavobacterium chilense TaxID=946677 RepID=A0A1M6ZBS5_9FLAO|nr:hypothetical protein [Flavobacterium chilense]SHL27932.1 hypothetical protein SAMN05444484_101958 [Flavobacterium chilense]